MNLSDSFPEHLSFHNTLKLDITHEEVLETLEYLKPLIKFNRQAFLSGIQEEQDRHLFVGGVVIKIKSPLVYTIDLQDFSAVNRKNIIQIMDMKFNLLKNLEKLNLMTSNFRFEDKLYKLIVDQKEDVFLLVEKRCEEERKQELLKLKRKEEKKLEELLRLKNIEDLLFKLGFKVA